MTEPVECGDRHGLQRGDLIVIQGEAPALWRIEQVHATRFEVRKPTLWQRIKYVFWRWRHREFLRTPAEQWTAVDVARIILGMQWPLTKRKKGA